jgi:3',5'-cyclic AMP phosphodiesterase CpdA
MKKAHRMIHLLFIGFLLNVIAPMAATLSVAENIKAIEADKSGLSGEFNLVVVGDSRGNDRVYASLLKIAASYKQLFILVTGDVVNHGAVDEFARYASLIEPLSIPILHIPGNHDVRSGKANYAKFFSLLNWRFDYGPYRFIGLDNSEGFFSKDTLAFASESMQRGKTCLVAFHVPPIFDRWKVHAMNAGGHGDEMASLIEEAGVPYVFLGHIHLYDEIDRKGTKYVISAGGGAPLYDQYGFGKPEYGVVAVHLSPSGITHKWIPLPGQNNKP